MDFACCALTYSCTQSMVQLFLQCEFGWQLQHSGQEVRGVQMLDEECQEDCGTAPTVLTFPRKCHA